MEKFPNPEYISPLPVTESLLWRLAILPIEIMVTAVAAIALLLIIGVGLMVEAVESIKEWIFGFRDRLPPRQRR